MVIVENAHSAIEVHLCVTSPKFSCMCFLLVRLVSLVFYVYTKKLFIWPSGIVFAPLILADHWFGMDVYAAAVFSR
jgi:hypothetical protein